MKKVLIYMLVVAIGAALIYYALCVYNKKDKDVKESKPQNNVEEKKEIIPSKDEFVIEATKLQTIAEDVNGNDICKCYNVKELDNKTTLSGSILVYTSGDIYVSNMWLSNGYYLLEDSEIVTAGLLEESSKQASLYCGEASADIQSRLCDTNY